MPDPLQVVFFVLLTAPYAFLTWMFVKTNRTTALLYVRTKKGSTVVARVFRRGTTETIRARCVIQKGDDDECHQLVDQFRKDHDPTLKKDKPNPFAT